MKNSNNNLDLSHFPDGNYTPFGYLDNPYHSAIINRSGIIRSVPPLGFGFWARDLPWPYADGLGLRRFPNYLSFLHLSIRCGDILLHRSDDFFNNKINLVSKYHTKSMMNYNFELQDIICNANYYLHGENSLLCKISFKNTSEIDRNIILHGTNIYGYPQNNYWGSDGLVSNYDQNSDSGISKIWAYGDIFIIGSNRKSSFYKATASVADWNKLVVEDNINSNEGITLHFNENDNHIYTTLSYKIDIPAQSEETMILSLTRGKNESETVNSFNDSLKNADIILEKTLETDKKFYDNFPMIHGDWPISWKHGWIYDFETIRMNIRPPIGIYKHHWDAMQVHSPRSVLGEAALDCMMLSYADVELAKEVLLGIFADAPMPNVPCSREDGSMNMISAHGKECGTAPIWGMPFMVILSIYNRCGDLEWIKKLYPYLKEYLDWWIENRTDSDGWFHASCSWESGQDASKRFLVADHDPGAAIEFVRTVDITAAMGHAFKTVSYFAELFNDDEAFNHWNNLADDQIRNTKSMFLDGWYRDFDSRTNSPIILKDYFDVMMFTPVAFNLATTEEIDELIPMFKYFEDNPKHWLEWPSFIQVFSEAAWYAGNRKFLSNFIANTANRIYPHIDNNNLLPVGNHRTDLPEKYNYRIPGVANEFWPIDLAEGNPGGCENYGWGATMPALIIRNIIGFRELDNKKKTGFSLSPSIPDDLLVTGKVYAISNINFQDLKLSVSYKVEHSNAIAVEIKFSTDVQDRIVLTDGHGKDLDLSFENDKTKVIVDNFQSITIYL